MTVAAKRVVLVAALLCCCYICLRCCLPPSSMSSSMPVSVVLSLSRHLRRRRPVERPLAGSGAIMKVAVAAVIGAAACWLLDVDCWLLAGC